MEVLLPFILPLIISVVGGIIICIVQDKTKASKDKYDSSRYQVLSEKQLQGATVRVIREIDGDDGRRLNGKPLQNQNDWDRWWVLKGKGDGYVRRLYEIENEMAEDLQSDLDSLRNEWNRRYDAYKYLCKEHGMWNEMLKDHQPYIPTHYQLEREKALFSRIESICQHGMVERELYQKYQKEILDFLLTKPGHKVIRKKLFQHFHQEDPQKNKQFKRIYNKLVENHVLSDRKNPDGNYYVRKAPKRKAPSETSSDLPHSSFDSIQYINVDNKLLYKAEYSVASPIDLDIEKNTCTFISQTSGEKYRTSLSQCTCPVYDPSYRYPCKHMVALALHLGYISKTRIK